MRIKSKKMDDFSDCPAENLKKAKLAFCIIDLANLMFFMNLTI